MSENFLRRLTETKKKIVTRFCSSLFCSFFSSYSNVMSEENLDVEVRPRSLLRQVGQTLGVIQRSRNATDNTIDNAPAAILLNRKRGSMDSLSTQDLQSKYSTKKATAARPTTPISFLNQVVKSHWNKTKKFPQTNRLKNDEEEYTHLSLPSSQLSNESKSSTTPFDENSLQTNSIESEVFVDTLTDRPVEEPSFDEETQTTSMSQNNEKNSMRFPRDRSPSLTLTSDRLFLVDLHIQQGKDLSIKDLNGTSDPYVKIFAGSTEKYTTNIVYKSLNPIWDEKCAFFISDLTVPIRFDLFDYDRIGRDEPMGTTKLDLSTLNLDVSNLLILDLENEKRNDGKIGTIQISVTISANASPQIRDEILRTFSKPLSVKSASPIRNAGTTSNSAVFNRRTIDVFLIEGRILSSSNKILNPYVRLKFGSNKKFRTQAIKSTNQPKWHQSFIYEIYVNELPPLELTLIDDTGGSGDFIGRGFCNLTNLDEEKTHKISVDFDDHVAVIDVFITITGTAPSAESLNDGETSFNTTMTTTIETVPSKLTEKDVERYTFLSSIRSIQPVFDVGKVEIKIYQARDLSAKDMNGKSDPFCLVELDSTRLRTQTIYKTLDPVWNKSFLIPVQDIHSVLELTIFDEDVNKNPEFIGKVALPLLAISNGERKWLTLKDRKCLLPVKGFIEIEATLIYTNFKAIIRTFNPRQTRYYQTDGKFRVGLFKQHINRVRTMISQLLDLFKFINYCFQWENPMLSFLAFMISLIVVWNFELYMFPLLILLVFGRNALIEYRRGRLGKSFSTLGDETVSAVIQPGAIDEDALDAADGNIKEQKKSLMSVIHGIQETVVEVQGYVDEVASTLERVKNLFNFTVPWLSILAIVILTFVSIILYYIPLRYLVLAFVINKFTKRFRKPKDFVDNNELADFISRLPSDPELLQYREMKIFSRLPSPKKAKRQTSNGK